MNDEDIVEIKPSFGPFTFNLRALWRRLINKPEIDHVSIVAKRFIKIFEEHGVTTSQIPRLIPEITLDKLQSSTTLLPALTSDVLEKTANLFKIRRAWLEGLGNQIYDCLWCYKDPERFFQELATLKIERLNYSIMAFCCTQTLDKNNKLRQPIVIVFAEKLTDLDGEEIYRYRIFDDGWHWDYWKCRIQLKAMARVVYQVLHVCIPLYLLESETLFEIESGHHVPRAWLKSHRRLHDISLEDFGLSPDESAVSAESEELPHVLEYIKAHKLEKIARKELQKSRS
jgi:hypothetical protein